MTRSKRKKTDQTAKKNDKQQEQQVPLNSEENLVETVTEVPNEDLTADSKNKDASTTEDGDSNKSENNCLAALEATKTSSEPIKSIEGAMKEILTAKLKPNKQKSTPVKAKGGETPKGKGAKKAAKRSLIKEF